jgi:hypothetical protein
MIVQLHLHIAVTMVSVLQMKLRVGPLLRVQLINHIYVLLGSVSKTTNSVNNYVNVTNQRRIVVQLMGLVLILLINVQLLLVALLTLSNVKLVNVLVILHFVIPFQKRALQTVHIVVQMGLVLLITHSVQPQHHVARQNRSYVLITNHVLRMLMIVLLFSLVQSALLSVQLGIVVLKVNAHLQLLAHQLHRLVAQTVVVLPLKLHVNPLTSQFVQPHLQFAVGPVVVLKIMRYVIL